MFILNRYIQSCKRSATQCSEEWENKSGKEGKGKRNKKPPKRFTPN